MILTGLRGVGKTVLLGRFEDHAAQRDWATVDTEITKDMPFGRRMVALARQALLQLSPKSKWKDRATRAAGVLRSFELTVDSTGALSAGLNTERVEGKADTGDLGPDLTDLFLALGEAAADHGTGVVSSSTKSSSSPSPSSRH